MPPPLNGWRDKLSALEDLYERHVKGGK